MKTNDLGTRIRTQVLDQDGVAVDLSQATSVEVTVTSPYGLDTTVTPTLESGGTTGWAYITKTAGIFHQIGRWNIEYYVKFSDDEVFHSTNVQVTVEETKR